MGYGWAALLLARGYSVLASDPAAGAEERLRSAVNERWPALVAMGLAKGSPPVERLAFAGSLAEMAARSDLVQENAPEDPGIKSGIVAEIDAHLPADRLILSSSGGLPPTQLQSYCQAPERLLVGHPFHPAHIIPLVEVVPGEATVPQAVDLALSFYRDLGKRPILVKREMVGHLVNRLQFALLREASFCLAEGVASASDIDGAVRWGLGARWALMGSLMTWNLAGGEGGLESLLDRFAGDVQRWWDALASPSLTPEVRRALIEGADELKMNMSNTEWADWRDKTLIAFARFGEDHPFPGDPKSETPPLSPMADQAKRMIQE
ncbi:3-hydroxyacyl-CoA dehydrogenase [Sphingobium sp. AEW010]|nr:3-hydroxyacyl-CoA dehydrogenase [Sphingobium sp. AEW010]TWD17779.1 3-hydroxyacyl-CoA dehydrogenase [Sphingobium sp. AEW013]TWD20025.1 3-hydroxyacyl-CoA dehydrogenase [Sphingobium sp. AEW001]